MRAPQRQATISERITSRLKEFRLNASTGPPQRPAKPEVHFDADEEEKQGAPKIDKGKGRADADNTRIDQWFTPGKGTGVRLTYTGPGHPLNLFVYVARPTQNIDGRADGLHSAEETGGPTASCEVTTWDPEPRMVLGFDADRAYVPSQPPATFEPCFVSSQNPRASAAS